MPPRLPLAALLLLLLAACSGIPIEETDVFQDSPTVYPSDLRARAEDDSFAFEDLTIPVAGDSVRLNAWLITQPGARGTVLQFGGNGFSLVNSEPYIDAYLGYGMNLLMVDYRGYGKSNGTPTVEALKADALAVLDALAARPEVDADRIVVHGHSMGTVLALWAGAQRTVAGVVLENPISTPEAWADHLIPWFLEPFISFDLSPAILAQSNVELVEQVEEPLLIAAGASDQVTDPEMAETLAETAAPEQAALLVIEGEGHNGLYRTDAFAEAYAAFLDRALPPAAVAIP